MSLKFDNFWNNDGQDNRIAWGILTVHLICPRYSYLERCAGRSCMTRCVEDYWQWNLTLGAEAREISQVVELHQPRQAVTVCQPTPTDWPNLNIAISSSSSSSSWGRPRRTNWSCAGLVYQQPETAPSASLHHAFGTVCRQTSPQQEQYTASFQETFKIPFVQNII